MLTDNHPATHRDSNSRENLQDVSLKIWGRFPPTWIGGLSSGLSRSGISIVSGNAKKTKTVW
jgi:hypothetical protein